MTAPSSRLFSVDADVMPHDWLVFSPEEPPVSPGDLMAVRMPCPAYRGGGGIGGQMISSCGWCGSTHSSTALNGPHGRVPVAMSVRAVIESSDGWLIEVAPLAEDGES